VDAERAAADAILVGAGPSAATIPGLLVRLGAPPGGAPRQRAARPARRDHGHASGDLDPAACSSPATRANGRGGVGRGAAASAGAGAAGDGDMGRGGGAARRIVYAATPVLPKLGDQPGAWPR
jgi:hypothetical protein